jgi:hypothetical protein
MCVRGEQALTLTHQPYQCRVEPDPYPLLALCPILFSVVVGDIYTFPMISF